MRCGSRASWSVRAPAIEMLDGTADADDRADDDERRQVFLRALAAALGVLNAAPQQM